MSIQKSGVCNFMLGLFLFNFFIVVKRNFLIVKLLNPKKMEGIYITP